LSYIYIVIKVDKTKTEIQMGKDGKSFGEYYLIQSSKNGDTILERENGNPIAVINNVNNLTIPFSAIPIDMKTQTFIPSQILLYAI
jgi:hypothetical protein